jgi:hypothetical protein
VEWTGTGGWQNQNMWWAGGARAGPTSRERVQPVSQSKQSEYARRCYLPGHRLFTDGVHEVSVTGPLDELVPALFVYTCRKAMAFGNYIFHTCSSGEDTGPKDFEHALKVTDWECRYFIPRAKFHCSTTSCFHLALDGAGQCEYDPITAGQQRLRRCIGDNMHTPME